MSHFFKTQFLVFGFLISFIGRGQAALEIPISGHPIALTWTEAQAQYAQLKQEFNQLKQIQQTALDTQKISMENLKAPLRAKAIECADLACLQALQDQIKKIDESINLAQQATDADLEKLRYQFILDSRSTVAMARVDILNYLVAHNPNVAHFEVEADGGTTDTDVILRSVFKSSSQTMFETRFSVMGPAFCHYSTGKPPACDVDAELKFDGIFAQSLGDLDGTLIDSVNKVVGSPSDDLVTTSGDDNSIKVHFLYSLAYQRNQCMNLISLKSLCKLLN